MIVLLPATALGAYRQTYGFVDKWAFPALLGFAPQGMSIAPNGNLLIANNGDYVSEYTTAGVKVAELGGGLGLFQIIDVAARSGDMWVLNPNNDVCKLTLAGASTGVTLAGSPRPFSMTSAVAVDDVGCVYVADKGGVTGYDVQITKFSPSGAFITTFGTTGPANANWLWSASSISVGPGGNVFVADWQGGTVRKYSPTNSARTSYVPTARWKSSSFESPAAVAADPNGNVFVLDSSTKTVTKLNSAGTPLARWGGDGSSNGKFTTPWSLAVAANGNVFVDDRDGLIVQQFKLLDLGPTTSAAGTVTVKKGKKATFKFKADEDISSTVVVTLKVYKGSKLKATIKCGAVAQGVWRTKSWTCKLAKGTYTWKVYAVDGAGHTQRNVASKTLKIK